MTYERVKNFNLKCTSVFFKLFFYNIGGLIDRTFDFLLSFQIFEYNFNVTRLHLRTNRCSLKRLVVVG